MPSIALTTFSSEAEEMSGRDEGESARTYRYTLVAIGVEQGFRRLSLQHESKFPPEIVLSNHVILSKVVRIEDNGKRTASCTEVFKP
jgi:hypothetical protein